MPKQVLNVSESVRYERISNLDCDASFLSLPSTATC